MDLPPLLTPPTPKVKKSKRNGLLTKRQRMVGKVLCCVLRHNVEQMEWEDSHGGMDGMSRCVRCGALDV